MNILDIPMSGGCQCGAIRYHETCFFDSAHICHCRMCQKAVGNAFAALVAAPSNAFQWTRGKPTTWRSSQNIERGFCRDCGTPLFYLDANEDRIFLTIGSVDKPERFSPKRQVGIEGRIGWFNTLHQVADTGETEKPSQAEWAAAIKVSNRQHPDHDTGNWLT